MIKQNNSALFGRTFEIFFTFIITKIRLIRMPVMNGDRDKIPANTWGWWVEIVTLEEPCTYYFGEFETHHEAEVAKDSYIQDLREEGHQNMLVQIRLGIPEKLTVFGGELSGEKLFREQPGLAETRIDY